MKERKIRSALLSVYHKDGLEPIVQYLAGEGVRILSTGGTAAFIRDMGVEVQEIESLTGYPSVLGGRVKTLHPKVFGGILARRENEADQAEMAEFEIPVIDLVLVDLYPFEATLRSSSDEAAIIEKIDIGGIALIRAAAKNFDDVLVVPGREYYGELMELLEAKGGSSDRNDRKRFAAAAFHVSSHYDTAIFNYFNKEAGYEEVFKVSFGNGRSLRYGENPHQKGYYYGNLDELFTQLHGKALSYNNLVDIDAALDILEEFDGLDGRVTFAVLKHTNPCGLATRSSSLAAWEAALAGDPVSAFGGIIASNGKIDEETALAINALFFEVILAPEFDEKALEILKSRKKRIILKKHPLALSHRQFKTAANGVLLQDKDRQSDGRGNWQTPTVRKPDDREMRDMEFGIKAVKHLKSNAIALVKDEQMIGMGAGQTSRIDALKQAIDKAGRMGFETKGAVLASDAFFPFADSVEAAFEVGIEAIVQPGGSKRDHESVDFCNEKGMCMVMTGIRHFKH